MRDGVAAMVARKERIMGRLSLIKQNHVIFLAWLPNSAGSMLPDGTFHTSPLLSHPAAPATGECHGTGNPAGPFYIYVWWIVFSYTAEHAPFSRMGAKGWEAAQAAELLLS